MKGYLKLTIKTIQQFPNKKKRFVFEELKSPIELSKRQLLKFKLGAVYPENKIFVKFKNGNEDEGFEDVKLIL